MANVLNRTTKVYITSADTGQYDTADWIINPDVAAVAGYPTKYWTITGDVVTLMDQTAQDAVDAAEAAAVDAADRAFNKSRLNGARVLKALTLVIMDEVNTLRAQHGLSQYTPAQVLNAVENKIDSI